MSCRGVPRLERVRDEWLETPHPELHMRTPRSIKNRERARLPEGGAYDPIDADCPCCQMLADMPGPSFWHLDGTNMVWEFAFAIRQKTREEWDKEQAEWAELDRRREAEWREDRSLGLVCARRAWSWIRRQHCRRNCARLRDICERHPRPLARIGLGVASRVACPRLILNTLPGSDFVRGN